MAMERRQFIKTGVVAGAFGVHTPLHAQEARAFYEIRTYELRNDLEPARIQAFFGERILPAARAGGFGPIGVFTPEAGLINPSLVVVMSYAAAGDGVDLRRRALANADLDRVWREFETGGALPYVRYDASCYHAFAAHPRVELPQTSAARAPRIFEWRIYESRDQYSLQNKIDMFNREEIRIFRKVGMAPVLFGEAVYGTRLPHLTYMVGFDDMGARMKAWDTFRADPDWVKIRDLPGWSNADAVSTTRTIFLRPTAFSDIR